MSLRDGEPQDPEDFFLLAFFGAGYLLLIAWVVLRIRERRVLGDAMLNLSPSHPRVGAPFTCRMQFERQPPERGPVRGELYCHESKRMGIGSTKKVKTTTLWSDTQIAPTSAML